MVCLAYPITPQGFVDQQMRVWLIGGCSTIKNGNVRSMGMLYTIAIAHRTKTAFPIARYEAYLFYVPVGIYKYVCLSCSSEVFFVPTATDDEQDWVTNASEFPTLGDQQNSFPRKKPGSLDGLGRLFR